MRRARLLVIASFAVLAFPARDAPGHALCFDSTCCTPHGTVRNDVCEFEDCFFDGTYYHRTYDCVFPLGDGMCAYDVGQSMADRHHRVTYGAGTEQVAMCPSDQPPDCAHPILSVDLIEHPDGLLLEEQISLRDYFDPPPSLVVTAVWQDEPVNAAGDHDTRPDAVLGIDGSVLLRAERAGGGSGRLYFLDFEATDEAGNTCHGTASVCVPHDESSVCRDTGKRYSSTD